ncbi:OmcA/MtrC family decaheme c-type cytochrome [Shewanella sp. KX20019]|uniref:OmcA/MtrC family decaheme c-type cytochrome n=1 Tax=Shewanella sp. KX20019 TaxID=2803864 RepID=UPI001927D328|nr:OmcA/MtrC family decaheme c-type cytochrome [Shewanella sp. KX20019]QQX78870.1 OmcA/MtrC family decaheme c-type cytochrome [Shewanella sp. KX20019]
MMKFFNLSATSKALLSAGVLSLAVSGCSGDDGKNGEDGKPGPVGTPIGSVSQVQADITSASVSEDGFLTVNFNLADANGAAVFGMQQTDIGALSFGRMGTEDEVAGTDIEGSPREIWLSYFNKEKTLREGDFTGSSYFKGASCEDCLTDNGDGSYALTLNKAIDTLDKYAFDAEVTNGIYLSVKSANDTGSILVNNSFFYWQPSSDTAQEKPKAVIANETCQSCHRPGQDGALSMHGDKHVTLESCTFCHTDYNIYMKQDKDEDGNAVGEPYQFDGSIKAMAHDIHSHSFYAEDGIYPQMASNCQTCHQPDENVTMADAWKADLDTATCMSCHNSEYAVPSWHWNSDSNKIDDSKQNCVSCHNDPDGYRAAERGHYAENNNAQAAELKVVFNSMTYADSTITANLSVKDGEELVPFNQIDKRPYKYGGYNSAIVVNGVLTDDFLVNYQKVGWDKLIGNTDGTITAVITADDFNIEPIITANATITLSSQLHVCYDGKGIRAECTYTPGENSDGTPSKGDGTEATDLLDGQEAPYLVSDTFFFKQDGTAVTESPRAQHAEMTACQQCHTTSIVHRYTNDVDGCASCHNGTRDKKGTGSSNLAYIVHSKHYLYNSADKLFFKKTECQSCHGEDGYSIGKINVDAAPVAFGKVVTGEELNYAGKIVAKFGEKTFVSPQAAACVSCHQKPYGLSDSTISHINGMGGAVAFNSSTLSDGQVITSYGLTQTDYDAKKVQETCSTCHNDEQLLEAHSNWGSSY